MARYSPSGNFILRRFKENVVERRNQPNTTPSWKRSSTRGSKTTSDTLVTRKAITSIQPSAPTTSLTVEGKTVTKRWLYHMLNYKRVLIDSFLWSIGGLTPRWHHREQYFAFLSQKKNRFYVAGGLHCSDKSQKTPKCGKNISDTLGCALYAETRATFLNNQMQDQLFVGRTRLRAPQAVFLIFQCYFLCSDGPVRELLFEFYVT